MLGRALDALVAVVSPESALRRRAARNALAYYEAAKPSRVRKFRTDQSPQNMQVRAGAVPLRTQARHLEQNHDIARGALRTLVNNLVGPSGIGIEPQPRRRDGSIHDEYAAALREAWRDWTNSPEVTQRFHFAAVQRLMARSWIRDGEVFAQLLVGPVQFLNHGSRVPFSIEMLEADMVPIDYDDGDTIRQGVERNAWGRPVAYWVYKTPPAESPGVPTSPYLKRIEASRMVHLALVDRIGQIRGVSEFASVITRLEDIKDYEESERVAAKVAAMLTAYVKKGTPDIYDPSLVTTDEDGFSGRDLRLAPGMIVDSLMPGEEIGLIDSKRPNPNVITFRQGQLRAVAAGLGASYSSISRDYNGTYSAQRQELVEQWIHYATLTDEFVGQFVRPVWETFVQAADMSGVVRIPPDVVDYTADDALYVGQSMPWIDPLKEASAWRELVRSGFASEVEVMRRRGVNPRDVMEQIASWRAKARERGLVFDSDAGMTDNKGAANDPVVPDSSAG